jgi:hypothetical protein
MCVETAFFGVETAFFALFGKQSREATPPATDLSRSRPAWALLLISIMANRKK